MLKLLQCECIKLKRSKFLLTGILSTLIVPLFVIVMALTKYFTNPGTEISLFTLYDNALMFLMLLSAPIALTVLNALVIIQEYTNETLKNILAIPVSQTYFFTGKLLFLAILALLFMLVSWLEILLFAFLCNIFFPVADLTLLSAIFFLIKMLYGGILLFATQMPFLYLTVRTKGFAAPLIAITAVSLLTVVLSGSPAAGFYPWSASYLLVTGRLNCPKAASIIIILTLCILGIIGVFFNFRREKQ